MCIAILQESIGTCNIENLDLDWIISRIQLLGLSSLANMHGFPVLIKDVVTRLSKESRNLHNPAWENRKQHITRIFFEDQNTLGAAK